MKLRFVAFAQKLSGILNIWLLLAALVFAGILLQGNGMVFPGAGDEDSDSGKELVISGPVRVSDGDSLRFGEERVRIVGIDAPELDQTCKNPDGSPWPCGRVARQSLLQLVAKGGVTCTYEKRDRYGRALGLCLVDGVDIGGAMVSQGMAVSYDGYPEQEAYARNGRKGMWRGEFIMPRDWRRKER